MRICVRSKDAQKQLARTSLSTLSQAILSVIKQDLPDHEIDRSQAEKATAPVGQSAEQSAVESVDQTGKVKATKRHLPIEILNLNAHAAINPPLV